MFFNNFLNQAQELFNIAVHTLTSHVILEDDPHLSQQQIESLNAFYTRSCSLIDLARYYLSDLKHDTTSGGKEKRLVRTIHLVSRLYFNSVEFIGYLTEYRNSSYIITDFSESYMFRDFEYGEVVSTRYYDDVFPNDLSEIYNLNNNLQLVVNDQGDEDPSNDITTLAPRLGRLLSLTHPDDGVPAIFDRKITIDGSVEVDNILATEEVISIPGSYNKGSGIADYIAEQQINASVIEVIPELGVYYDNVEGYNPDLIEDYRYLYYDDDGDGVYNIIFVTDSEGYTGAIGLDYDGNSYFEPHKNILVEKHIIRSTPSASKDSELEILLKYSGHNLINYQDTGPNDNYDGLIMEPTFRDSLFDVWKMDYSGKSSELIELAMRITSHEFIEMLTPQKIFGDIAFQVSAQLAAYITGKVVGIGLVALFSAAGSSVPGLGTAIGFVVGMLTYWLINSIYQIEQAKKRNNYIAYQATYNENYDADADKTLSERWWKDEYFSETMTHTLQGTRGGIYSEVKAETDKYIYTGQVILASPGVEKTTNFGTEVKNIVLDYSQQTRSYLAYSDWGERLNPFFDQVVEFDLGHLTISATVPRDRRVKFMRNSIMYLEDQIYAETSSNDDKSYDRIIPYMMAVKPSLQFADSDSMVAPEFYLNYPIYVDHEEYIADHGDGKLRDEYYHIYKVYDTTNEGTIQLIPEEYITNRPLRSDIVKIEAWLVDTLGNEEPLGDVVSRHDFNNITGEVTFTFDEYLNFNTEIIRAKENNKGIYGYDAYIVLEFCIEKYRDITVERDDITPEEAQRIATMQSAHQSILEYTYQYTIAERTQERLSEICYTMFVTITSTLLVMGATWGLNKAFAGVEANVYANAASKSLTKFGESSKAYGAISNMAEKALRTSGRSLAFNMFKVTCAVITETLEELYVDPMIEAYVTNKLKDAGKNEVAQILWSGLAESGREQFLSSVTSFMRAGFGGRTQVDTNIQPSATNIPNAIESNLENRLATQEAKAQQQLRQEYLKEGISTILMFTGAIAGGFGGSIGTALGNIMMVAGTSVEGIESIKDMFETVLKKDQLDISVETITLSDEQKAPFTEYKFRFSELPLQTGLRVIRVDPTQKIADYIEEHFPSKVPQGNLFIYKGQVLDELRSLLEYGVDPKNPIYVVHPMAAAGIARDIDSQRIYGKFDRIIRKYLSTLTDFGSETLKKYTNFVDWAARELVPLSFPLSGDAMVLTMKLRKHAEHAFASEKASYEQRSILTNRGRHLVNTLCDAYGCSPFGLGKKLGLKKSSQEKLNQLLISDTPVSFRFLKYIYRKAREDLYRDQATSVFEAIKGYNPVFSIFIATRGYKTSDTLKRLTYLETTERHFEGYRKQSLIKFKEAGGDIKSIKAMNEYCTWPNAYWEGGAVRSIQSELLLELWDHKDALTGNEIIGTMERHHYRIAFKQGTEMGYVKFDCRLQALVPLSKTSHGVMRTFSTAREHERNFRGVMEKLMRGEWTVPLWWRNTIDGVSKIKEFEQNLLWLGFVKPT